MEPTRIDEGILELGLTDVPALVGIQVDSPVGTSGHSAVFIDDVLEQPIPLSVCRQKVYLKNSVDWELVREEVMSLNRNEFIRSLYPVPSLNEALLHVIRERVPKRTIVIRTGDKP